jgi:molybdopterin-guanine dinucleotide biosynthesis adapter protein
MKVVHVVGRKNHGKTTLVAELVACLSQRGMRVGTIKNCHRDHELDTPGKDSQLHRKAGAHTVAAVTPSLIALFQRRDETADHYLRLAPEFAACDLVVIEGDVHGPGPKIEVWRAFLDTPPLAQERSDISAVVTNEEAQLPSLHHETPVLQRDTIDAVADLVIALAENI